MKKAWDWLSSHDPYALPLENVEIDGRNVYAFVQENRLERAISQASYEVHAKYADIQLILDGEESFGWSSEKQIADIDPVKDAGFGPAVTEQVLTLKGGQFVIFLPGEAHAPGLSDEPGRLCRKMVIKVLL